MQLLLIPTLSAQLSCTQLWHINNSLTSRSVSFLNITFFGITHILWLLGKLAWQCRESEIYILESFWRVWVPITNREG